MAQNRIRGFFASLSPPATAKSRDRPPAREPPVPPKPPDPYIGEGLRVLLDCHDRIFGSAVASCLRKTDPAFATCVETDRQRLALLCREHPPDIFLTELAPYSPYTAEERLELLETVRASAPDCKAVFCVDENAFPRLVNTVAELKRNGLIDQFIFASISETYLSALLDTL